MPDQEISMSQWSEEDIKRLYVTPALEAKWDKNKISMETRITDGKINLQGNLVVREAGKKMMSCPFVFENGLLTLVEKQQEKMVAEEKTGYGRNREH